MIVGVEFPEFRSTAISVAFFVFVWKKSNLWYSKQTSCTRFVLNCLLQEKMVNNVCKRTTVESKHPIIRVGHKFFFGLVSIPMQ